MCGIIGLISSASTDVGDFRFVEEGLRELGHRGPDYQKANWIDDKVIFGHTRLSIIDLSDAANQPMFSSDGKAAIVFNGEIYNYKDLKKYLRDSYEFSTKSDTEVVLACFRKYGMQKTLNLLDGFFAFSIYDTESKKVYLARDRVGKKPLYVHIRNKILYFASELRAFKNIPGFEGKLSRQTLQHVFLYKYSSHLSVFSDVEMLEMGSYMEIDLYDLSVKRKKYFDFRELVSENLYREYSALPEKELLDVFDVLMKAAVRKRLFASDVPVCTINSGGLDSSLVSTIAAKYQKIDLFHVDVENGSEHRHALELQKHLALPMYSLKLDDSNVLELFSNASVHYEYYMVHPNNAGIFLLATEISSKDYKVVLGGEAADELFGGYPHFNQYFKLLKAYRIVGKSPLKEGIEQLFRKYLFRIFYPSAGLSRNIKPDMTNNLAFIENKILLDDLAERYGFIEDDVEQFLQTLLLFDLYRYLQPLFLRGDKMFMAHGVELRLPFADVELMRFAFNLPIKFKRSKYLLKRLAERYIPRKIIVRQKEGFRIPQEDILLQGKTDCMGIPMALIDNRPVAIAMLGLEIYLNKVYGVNSLAFDQA